MSQGLEMESAGHTPGRPEAQLSGTGASRHIHRVNSEVSKAGWERHWEMAWVLANPAGRLG
jgi:hypothetical protein